MQLSELREVVCLRAEIGSNVCLFPIYLLLFFYIVVVSGDTC